MVDENKVDENKIEKIKKHLLEWQKVYLCIIALVLLLASNFYIENLKKTFFKIGRAHV